MNRYSWTCSLLEKSSIKKSKHLLHHLLPRIHSHFWELLGNSNGRTILRNWATDNVLFLKFSLSVYFSPSFLGWPHMGTHSIHIIAALLSMILGRVLSSLLSIEMSISDRFIPGGLIFTASSARIHEALSTHTTAQRMIFFGNAQNRKINVASKCNWKGFKVK